MKKKRRTTIISTAATGLALVGYLLYQTPESKLELKELFPAHLPENVISHTAFSLKYSEEHEQAEWVAYILREDHLNLESRVKRIDNFRSDTSIKTKSASPEDYYKSGYDRGHLVPAFDLAWSKETMSESFLMSNISPQVPGFNRGIWKRLESKVRQLAIDNKEICIITGPVLPYKMISQDGLTMFVKDEDRPSIGEGVTVPEQFYKVILDYKKPEIKAIGFLIPNQPSNKILIDFVVPIDSIEIITLLDFFPFLSDSLEKELEGTVDHSKWF